MAIVSIDEKNQTIQVASFKIQDQEIYNYFDRNKSKTPDEEFMKALKAGIRVLQSEELRAFLDLQEDELLQKYDALIASMKKPNSGATIFDEEEPAEESPIKNDEDLRTYLCEQLQSRLSGCEVGLQESEPASQNILITKKGQQLSVWATMNKKVDDLKFTPKGKFTSDCLLSKRCEVYAIDKGKFGDGESVRIIPNEEKLVFAVMIDVNKKDFSNLYSAIEIAFAINANRQRNENYDHNVMIEVVKSIVSELNEVAGLKSHLETCQKSEAAIEKILNERAENVKKLLDAWNEFLQGGRMTNLQMWTVYVNKKSED